MAIQNRKCIIISYHLYADALVGSARSRHLCNKLQQLGVEVLILHRHSFGPVASWSKTWWSCRAIARILSSSGQALYISCGPFWTIIAALVAAIFSKKNLVIDFRDPWSPNLHQMARDGELFGAIFRLPIARIIEKCGYRLSKAFWVVTPGMRDSYTRLFDDSSKLHLVTNGFDLPLQSAEQGLKREDSPRSLFKIVCLGKFAEEGIEAARRTCEIIREAVDANRALPFQLLFVGTDPVLNSEILKEAGLLSCATFTPRMRYGSALQLAAQSDLAILISRNEEWDFGTKVFDYIALGIPILDTFDPNAWFHRWFGPFLLKPPIRLPLCRPQHSIEEIGRFSRDHTMKEAVQQLVKLAALR